jgi:hypothetical protein
MRMHYEEFRRRVMMSGLQMTEFARLIGRAPGSLSRYGKEDNVPALLAVIAVLVEACARNQIDVRALLSGIAIKPNKPRGAGFKRRSSHPDILVDTDD